jgi:serine phosphatase RsbU (regulator of sigma subunit)
MRSKAMYSERRPFGRPGRGSRSLLHEAADHAARHRRRAAFVLTLLEWAFIALVGAFATHEEVLGVTGAGAALIAVIAAVIAGPWLGGAVAAAGGVAFFVYLTDQGLTAPLVPTLISVIIWVVSAVIAGLVAGAWRREEAGRERALRQALDAQSQSRDLLARLEASLLPPAPIAHGSLEVAVRYLAAEKAMLLGGDFLDVVETGDGMLAFIVGDVTGHGPDAAALGATMRAGWQALVRTGAAPHRVMSSLESLLERERDSEDVLATICAGWLDHGSGALVLATRGHPLPILSTTQGAAAVRAQVAPPLGTGTSGSHLTSVVELPEAFDLLLYTDGLVERRGGPGSGQRFEDSRLARSLRDEWARADGTEGAIDRLLGAMRADGEHDRQDDVAAMLIAARSAAEASRTRPGVPLAAGASGAGDRVRPRSGASCEAARL